MSKQLLKAAEPFWFAVVSEKSPVANRAIRNFDVACEYAAKCLDNGYGGVKVEPLYRKQDLPVPGWLVASIKAIAEKCTDADTTDALDELLAAAQEPRP